MKDLLIIILLIILLLILFIYLHIDKVNIENFLSLHGPFLGPIEFVDKDNNDKLGEYPENWRSIVDNENDYKVTTVKINRGLQGPQGKKGTDAQLLFVRVI